MGADLYIKSLYDANRKKWETRFNEAVALRDSLEPGTPEHHHAQSQVEEYFSEMNSLGYFRDSYNPWNLLWKFDLSWWEDVSKLLDREHRLSPEKARELLRMLKEREPVFEGTLASKDVRLQRYFRSEYQTLQDFLNQAIELDEPIDCNI